MLSPQLRKKVHNLWSLFWTAGIANPLAAIEQITYLLFIRQLEGLDRVRVNAKKKSIYSMSRTIPDPQDKKKTIQVTHEECRWSYIRQNPSFPLLNDVVFPWIRGLEDWLQKEASNGDDRLRQVTGRLSDAYFILDTNKSDTLTRAIGLIDDLFRHLDARSVNADIMGDIFEHLLEEVKESGKNGQFRTPRHVIRFMVDLLDPEVGSSILDPACGSGGFLINTLLHWKSRHTDPEVLKLEWDGTPHDTHPAWPRGGEPDFNVCFHGFDNDRTMVRIAWMNLLLHDLEYPSVKQLDSLSKRLSDDDSGSFDYVLANPPFTGSVDEGDLSENRQRFPGGRGNKPLTTKSELLFVWLILDLLKIGGRAAVIVPDGVLFGSTNAHRELRRQLLFENYLEGVISLPGNMFQPYSGVKTSILVFQKARTPDDRLVAGDPPRTQEVWFYEIEDEAYSLDQKRKARFGQDNDMWDACAKFESWKKYIAGQVEEKEASISTEFWQPEYWEERWRVVDNEFLKIFPNKENDKGHTYPIHEIWRELPRDPREAETLIVESQRPVLEEIFSKYCIRAALIAITARRKPDPEKTLAEAEKAAKDLANRIIKLIRDENLLDREFDQYGINALRPLLEEMKGKAATWAEEAAGIKKKTLRPLDMERAVDELRGVVREFAKLDGYNVWRRSLAVNCYPGDIGVGAGEQVKRATVQKSWIVPVRVWAARDTWGVDPDTGQVIKKTTHDKKGLVRSAYLEWLRDSLKVYETDGTVKKDHLDRLDPDCIEALELNLSAGRHKPYTFDAGEHRPPAELIGELDAIHAEIRERLGKLLNLVEGRA